VLSDPEVCPDWLTDCVAVNALWVSLTVSATGSLLSGCSDSKMPVLAMEISVLALLVHLVFPIKQEAADRGHYQEKKTKPSQKHHLVEEFEFFVVKGGFLIIIFQPT
jgi:hypothetical protein